MKKIILTSTVIGLIIFGNVCSFGFHLVNAQNINVDEEQILYDAENEIFKEIEVKP